MEFLKTFFPAFFIWQCFSLSPFALTKNSLQPKPNQLHSYLSVLSFFIQFGAFVYGLLEYERYTIFVDRQPVISIADIVSMTFIRITSITITIESWLKRSNQIDFLTKIDQIDRIMRTNLMIDLQYGSQKNQNFRNLLFGWIAAQLGLELAMVVRTCLTQDTLFQVYWAFYTIPLFLCMLRYQQFISYANLLYIRFRALNECIDQLKSTEFAHYQNVGNVAGGDIAIFLIVNQLKHFQRIYRLLIEANRMLCKLFHWSMLLNVGNDSLNLLVNMYWLIASLVQNNSKVELIGVSAWATFNAIMLCSLVEACHSICDEVIYYIRKVYFTIFKSLICKFFLFFR